MKNNFNLTSLLGSLSLVLAMGPLNAYAELAKTYNLTETDSQIIKFDKALKRAMIANPELATVKVLSKTELLVTGKGAGRTQLIVTYRDTPSVDHQVTLNVAPDQSRKEEIESTITALLKDLNPKGTVKFELKNIWINPETSVRREVDVIGSKIDGDPLLKTDRRKDKDVLQEENSKGSLNAQPLAGNYMVLLTGEVPNKAQKKRIHSVISALGVSVINLVKVTGPQQVKLSVRVAEVVKGNPFRSGASIMDRRDRVNIAPSGVLGTTMDFLLDLETNLDQATLALAHQDAFQIGVQPNGGNLFGVLSILEGNHLARVLAKPELIVQSGETAEFLVGGEVPIPTAQNAETITVTYKEFGVRLRFSPIITEAGEIQMTVAPEVSNIDESAGAQTGSIVVPGFRSRRANTTITLASGQSFVIGGLIQDNLRSSVSKIPFLGDIPIIGALFRSTSYEKDQSELAILVTPTFVEPIEEGAKIALPGENMDRPSAADGFFMGKIVEMLPEGKSVLPELSVKIGLEKP